MDIILAPHRVELFTASYHLSGELHMPGQPGVFINESAHLVFTLVGGLIQPLAQGAQTGRTKVTRCYAPKESIEVVGLPGIDMTDLALMPSTRRLTCFTETYVVRGDFHTGAESGPGDVFYFTAGPFFPATDVEIRAVKPAPAELGGTYPLAYVHRDAVRVLYSQDDQVV